jgi:hypothetical protein
MLPTAVFRPQHTLNYIPIRSQVYGASGDLKKKKKKETFAVRW